MKLGYLFLLQVLYDHYEEFQQDHFDTAFHQYFDCAENKELIREILLKCLFEVKFTKEEVKKAMLVYENRLDKQGIEQNQKEWEAYSFLQDQMKKKK